MLLGKWYPEQISEPKHILNFRQPIDPVFLRGPSEKSLFKWRVKTTYSDSIFGFFGRITEETIPMRLVTAVERVRASTGSNTTPLVAFAGKIRTRLPGMTLNLGKVDYLEMPGLFSACRATLGQECPDSAFLGSGKVVDSIASGVPVISARNKVREEQLGADYRGLFDTQEEADHIIHEACANEEFYAGLLADTEKAKSEILPEAIGALVYQTIRDLGVL